MSDVVTSSSRRWLLIIGILLIASTLRVTFTGAAPLLDSIRAEYGPVSYTHLTLPTICSV